MDRFLGTKIGQIFISVLWGLGLSALFRQICLGRNCIVVKVVNPELIKNKIFKYNNNCYQYHPEVISCEENKGKKIISTFQNKK